MLNPLMVLVAAPTTNEERFRVLDASIAKLTRKIERIGQRLTQGGLRRAEIAELSASAADLVQTRENLHDGRLRLEVRIFGERIEVLTAEIREISDMLATCQPTAGDFESMSADRAKLRAEREGLREKRRCLKRECGMPQIDMVKLLARRVETPGLLALEQNGSYRACELNEVGRFTEAEGYTYHVQPLDTRVKPGIELKTLLLERTTRFFRQTREKAKQKRINARSRVRAQARARADRLQPTEHPDNPTSVETRIEAMAYVETWNLITRRDTTIDLFEHPETLADCDNDAGHIDTDTDDGDAFEPPCSDNDGAYLKREVRELRHAGLNPSNVAHRSWHAEYA